MQVAPSSLTHITCQDCTRLIQAEASICKHCGIKQTPTLNPFEVAQVEVRAEARTELKYLALGIGVFALLLYALKVISRTW